MILKIPRTIFTPTKSWFLIVFSIVIFSCKGQINSNSKTAKITTSPSTQISAYQDPLFFVEGQLCQHLREIFQDNKGNLWFGTNVYDLMHYNGDTLRYISEKDGFSGGRVTGITEDQEGNLWFATSSGLNKYNGATFEIYTTKDGLLDHEIWSLHQDSKGIFWIGHNKGLSRFDGKQFENIAIPKPKVKEPNIIYSADRITSIIEDEAGDLWLGTDGYGICKYDGKNFVYFTTDDGLCDNTIGDLMVDQNNNIWIGTFWGGVSKFDGKKFINYTQEGVISGVEAGAFYEDSNGDVWFGVENNGVYKYDGNTFSHYYKEQGLDGSTLSIFRDRKKRFWFGGWGGLFRFDGERFSSVSKEGPWD